MFQHDGIEKKHGWFLEDVHIVNMNTSEIYMFICKQWLSLYHGDYTIKKQLRAEPCDQPEMGNCSFLKIKIFNFNFQYMVALISNDSVNVFEQLLMHK